MENDTGNIQLYNGVLFLASVLQLLHQDILSYRTLTCLVSLL